MDGNVIEPVEKFKTEGEEKKPCYDKVMKIMGLTENDLSEKLDKIK